MTELIYGMDRLEELEASKVLYLVIDWGVDVVVPTVAPTWMLRVEGERDGKVHPGECKGWRFMSISEAMFNNTNGAGRCLWMKMWKHEITYRVLAEVKFPNVLHTKFDVTYLISSAANAYRLMVLRHELPYLEQLPSKISTMEHIPFIVDMTEWMLLLKYCVLMLDLLLIALVWFHRPRESG